ITETNLKESNCDADKLAMAAKIGSALLEENQSLIKANHSLRATLLLWRQLLKRPR
ncbi:hypothetical protein J6590_107932, partial [Homalodisca vitripennis]